MPVVKVVYLSKILKIFTLVWVVLSGLMMIVTGVVHYFKNDWFSYKFPSENTRLTSQGGFSLFFQAAALIIFGVIFMLLPFISLLGKIKFIVHLQVAYNRATLIVFYLVFGFMLFPMCGWMGFIFSILFWLSAIFVIVSIFFGSSISTFRSEDNDEN
ncbi:Vesicle transport protein [Entamoeba marina]